MPSNWAHVHLLLNHIPLLGVFFGLVLLAAASYWQNEEWKKAALWAFVIVALLAIPAYLTGEPAEDVVENLPGIEDSLIEEHEDSALLSLIGIEVLGAASLAGLFFFSRSGSIHSGWILACLLLAVVTAAMLGWTAHLGGNIHHPEARSDFAVPANAD